MVSTMLTSSPAVDSVLAANHNPHLRRLRVVLTDFEVVITGTVPNYYHKQLAQEAVRGMAGRRRLVNRVVVPGRASLAVAG